MNRTNAESSNEKIAMKFILQSAVDTELAEFSAWNQIPHEYSDGFMKRLRTIFRRYDKKSPSAISRRRRITIIIAAAVILSLLACTAIKPVREYAYEIITKWQEESVEISFEKVDGLEYPTYIEEAILPKLDESWSIETLMSNPGMGVYIITDPHGNVIYYDQNTFDNVPKISNNHFEIQKTTICKGIPAYICYYNDTSISLTWGDRYMFSLNGENVSEKYLIRLAEKFYK